MTTFDEIKNNIQAPKKGGWQTTVRTEN